MPSEQAVQNVPSRGPGPVDEPFKVIIVGGGFSGLVLAHAMHAAGFDYVVLDKHPIAPEWGSSITIQPAGSRILDQLGIMDKIHELCTPMTDLVNRNKKGKQVFRTRLWEDVHERVGYLGYTCERRAALQAIHDSLPDKTKVFQNARVSDIEEVNNKVRVMLADGTMHEGDLVVGCDGVHSTVRDIMWRRALTEAPGLITTEEKQSIQIEYNCLVGITPYMPGLGDREMTCVSFDKYSFLFLCQPDAVYYVVHCKLPNGEIIKYPNRKKYSEEEMEALAARIADCPVSDTLTFGDLWKNRTRGHLVSLEEGVLKHWHHGRIALCGDSAHKVTPNAGWGANLAIESAACLANELHRVVTKHPNQRPNDAELTAALDKYNKDRLPRVRSMSDYCWSLTRMQAYDGWLWWFVYRLMIPYVLGGKFMANDGSKNNLRAPILNYVPFIQHTGSLPWQKVSDPDNFQNSPEWQQQQREQKQMPSQLSSNSATATLKQSFRSEGSDISRTVFPVVVMSLLAFCAGLVWDMPAMRVPLQAGIGMVKR